MNLNPEQLVTVWYANEAGEKQGPLLEEEDLIKAGFIYRHMEIPGQVVETCERLGFDPDGGVIGAKIFEASATYPDDTATAMVRSGEWTVHQAALICARACSRCLNVLANTYVHPLEGYREGSEKWRKARTRCLFCS